MRCHLTNHGRPSGGVRWRLGEDILRWKSVGRKWILEKIRNLGNWKSLWLVKEGKENREKENGREMIKRRYFLLHSR